MYCRGTSSAPAKQNDRVHGVGEAADDGEPFEETMQRLVTALLEQQEEGRRLDEAIAENLEVLGYGE